MFRAVSAVFLAIIVLQWAIIFFLIVQNHNQLVPFPILPTMCNATSTPLISFAKTQFSSSSKREINVKNTFSTSRQGKYEGVAATLMINTPKWFQRRYSTMIQNVLDNTPPSWAVQIYYVPKGQSQFGLDLNPAIQRMNAIHDRLIMTEIPNDMVKEFGMKKKKFYWASEWMWESMVSDRVLVFSGNGAICSNSKLSLLDGSAMEIFGQFDYIGTPWRNHNGEGGDGSISYRNRTAMLHALRDQPFDGNTSEDYYFIKALKAINRKQEETGGDKAGTMEATHIYRIASKEETQLIGGIKTENFRLQEDVGPPMIISGTLSNLAHDIRNTVLEMCPEVKRIFPSLHHPGCFGAHPNGDACANSICALQNTTVRGTHGC